MHASQKYFPPVIFLHSMLPASPCLSKTPKEQGEVLSSEHGGQSRIVSGTLLSEHVMPVTKEHTSSVFSSVIAIPPAVGSALIDYWGNEDILRQPEILMELGPGAISRINRIGRKSLHQIAQALDSLGYIDSPESWLDKEK